MKRLFKTLDYIKTEVQENRKQEDENSDSFTSIVSELQETAYKYKYLLSKKAANEIVNNISETHFLHLNHFHPLLRGRSPKSSHSCEACHGNLGQSDYYVCAHTECDYLIHKSCFQEMPRELHHSSHRQHTLNHTVRSSEHTCVACKREFEGLYIYFECNSDKDFIMCAQCALRPDITWEGLDKHNIQQKCHEQPMILEENRQQRKKCCACELGCYGPTCSCVTCKCSIHTSCLELPPEIQYPFHQHNPLQRDAKPREEKIICKSCDRSGGPLIIFACNLCGFNICVVCSSYKLLSSVPTIKYQHHNHTLCLTEKIDKWVDRCDGYDTYCKRMVSSDDFRKWSTSYMLSCMECNFNLHLLCGPLPRTIKYECHVHSLVLVDSLAEDETAEYYCDICEKERDPRLCAYYCGECEYRAHVNCVISEVIRVLKQLPSGDEFIKQKGHSEKQTLENLIHKLSVSDKERLKLIFDWSGNESADEVESLRSDAHRGVDKEHNDNGNKNEEFGAYTDQELQLILNRVENPNFMKKLMLEYVELDLELENVEGFEIPLTFAPVLKEILKKYGNIIKLEEYNFSEAMGSFIYFVICRVASSMCKTPIVDITKDLLQQWHYQLHFLKVIMGLKNCGFLEGALRELKFAYMGLQVHNREEDVSRKLPAEIEKLELKLKRYEEELHKLKTASRFGKEDNLVKESVEKASQLNKWKSARHLLFDVL